MYIYTIQKSIFNIMQPPFISDLYSCFTQRNDICTGIVLRNKEITDYSNVISMIENPDMNIVHTL